MTTTKQISLRSLLHDLPGGPEGTAAQQIRKAYEFARRAHNDQLRESGELYIDHDLAVAHIIRALDVDLETLTATLLHDSLRPHTAVMAADLEQQFGDEIAALVVGLYNLEAYAEQRKVQALENGEFDKRALEVVRQAILSIIEGDIRIILIRMCDCLQDLRRLRTCRRTSSLQLPMKLCIFTPRWQTVSVSGS